MLQALPLLLLFLQNLAFGRTYPWSLLPGPLGRIFWAAVTVALIGWMARPLWPKPEAVWKLASRRGFLQAYAFLNVAVLAFSLVRFQSFGYAFPYAHLVVAILVLPWLRFDRLWLSFAFSLLWLLASMVHFPLHPDRSDMLPVISVALDRWWAGLDPYAPFDLAGRTNGLGYLPGNLFLHLPAWALGLDLRWNTVLYRLAWMALVARWSVRGDWQRRQPARVAGLHLFALSPFLGFRHELYFEGFWLGLALFCRVPASRVFVLPLLVVTRQWAWVLAPFGALIACLKRGRLEVRRVAALAASFAAVAGLGALLLRHGSAESLGKAIFWFQRYLKEPGFPGDYGPSFSPWLFALGHPAWLQKLQALFCVAMFGLCVKKGLSETRLWHFSAYTWIGFLLLNTHYWLYFWLSLIFFLILRPTDEEVTL